MVPTTRRDEASDTLASAGGAPRREDQYDGIRQPQMSEPSSRQREKGVEPDHWMVPDTRDDIVVSRMSDD